MARRTPLDEGLTDDFETLRRRWLLRYLTTQNRADTKIRSVLVAAATDAEKEIIALETKHNFSSKVRTAQLRLVMKIVREVLNDAFKKQIPIITAGSKESAKAAVTAFAETDRDILSRAFAESAKGSRATTKSFIEGQEIQAALSVANLVSRLEKSAQPLSSRVYRSKRLANTWVQREVNSAIVRNASAKEIAQRVRSSIRPNVSGGVSYASLRLGRTELNNAFHATSVALAQDRPWVHGMLWLLSATHEKVEGIAEICERYADQVFAVDHVPPKPHPQCRCFVVPQVESLAVFTQNLTAGVYKDWIEDAA